jgi:hypothetical protein
MPRSWPELGPFVIQMRYKQGRFDPLSDTNKPLSSASVRLRLVAVRRGSPLRPAVGFLSGQPASPGEAGASTGEAGASTETLIG